MTAFGNYRDALHFTDSQWALLLPGQLDDMIQERIDAWVKFKEQEKNQQDEQLAAEDAALKSGELSVADLLSRPGSGIEVQAKVDVEADIIAD